MPVPDRPVADAIIETDWGQEIHDRVFAPAGCHVHGATDVPVDVTYAGLPLDTVDEDPGGYLVAASDWIEIPADRGGLYLINPHFRSTGGTDGQVVLASYAINGAPVMAVPIHCETGAAVQGGISDIQTLAAGDLLNCQARKIPSGGADPDVQVWGFKLVRLGEEYGA